MEFKVIETFESGIKKIAAVPSAWEISGKLMWPPDKLHGKAIKTPLQPPGAVTDGWVEYPCIERRLNIISYAVAIQEVKNMSNHSDTSEMEEPVRKRMFPRRSAASRKVFVENGDANRTNYNEFISSEKSTTYSSITENSKPVSASGPTKPLQLVSSTINNMPTNSGQITYIFQNESDFQPSVQELVFDDVEISEGTTLSEPSIKSTLFAIIETQAKHAATLDYLAKEQDKILASLESVKSPFSSSQPVLINSAFNRMDTIEELADFEENLKDSKYAQEVIRKLQSVCGQDSSMYGDDVASEDNQSHLD